MPLRVKTAQLSITTLQGGGWGLLTMPPSTRSWSSVRISSMLCFSVLPPPASAPTASRQTVKKHKRVPSLKEPPMERTGILPSPGRGRATLRSQTHTCRVSGSATFYWSYDARKLHLPLSCSPHPQDCAGRESLQLHHQPTPPIGPLTGLLQQVFPNAR